MPEQRSPEGSADDRKTVEAQDDWLSGNVQAWYQAVIDEPVPDRLAALARQLDGAVASVVETERDQAKPDRQKPESDE